MINSITNGFPVYDQYQQFPPVKQTPIHSVIGQIRRLQLYLAPRIFPGERYNRYQRPALPSTINAWNASS